MKKRFLMMILSIAAAFSINSAQIKAADVCTEEAAEPTDITTFIDEIEVISPKLRTADTVAEDDYRSWTQDDSRWGSIELGASGKTMTKSGCLVTSVTKIIIQSGLKSADQFTPKTLVTWLNSNGGFTDGGGLYWGKPAEFVSGLSYHGKILEQKTDGYKSAEYNEKFVDLIKEGYHLIVQVKSGGHWVAVDEAKTLETGVIHIMDSLPANVNADITLAERYTTFDRLEAYTGGKTPEASGNNQGSNGGTTEPEDPEEHVHDYVRTVEKKATPEKVGKLKDTCQTCGYVKYVNISRIDTVKTQYNKYIYNGKVRKPKIVVTNKMGNVVNSKYYTVTYIGERKSVGKYTAIVEFKERYTGKYEVTFSIIPKKTSILKLTAKEAAFKVKWEKIEEEVGWYEIRYSTTSDFSKNAATKRVRSKYSSSTVRDLKADTTYYVKMRTYKKVGDVRFYSGWTPVEEITTN